MKSTWKIAVLAVAVCLAIPFASPYGAEKKESNGAKLYQQHCTACHPDGGNIIKPGMTLLKKDREAHGVKTTKDIIGKMRNPGPGMTKFDTKMISDKEAKEIAEYILATYK